MRRTFEWDVGFSLMMMTMTSLRDENETKQHKIRGGRDESDRQLVRERGLMLKQMATE
jgi:hypothetical protein